MAASFTLEMTFILRGFLSLIVTTLASTPRRAPTPAGTHARSTRVLVEKKMVSLSCFGRVSHFWLPTLIVGFLLY